MFRYLLVALLAAFTVVIPVQASEIVVLGEEPAAVFTLPDGSVLKNAFVWKRSSEGLMIVHDDGQYFLNYKLLPPEWRAAYLGETAPADAPPERPAALSDPHSLKPLLDQVPGLRPAGTAYLLRADADAASEAAALALGLLQSLLSGQSADASRLLLYLEESGMQIEGISREELSEPCSRCGGTGRTVIECKSCAGTGKCRRCAGTGERSKSLGAEGTYECIACKGTGECPDCGGKGGEEAVCRACRGTGLILKRSYCEALRGFYTLEANRAAQPNRTVSVLQTDRDRMMQTLFKVPELGNGAVNFYGSQAYDGSMDTNLVVTCIMQSLLDRDFEQAQRFVEILTVNYGAEVLDIEKYLTRCEACAGTGAAETPCPVCGGTGDCRRCGGDGRVDLQLHDKTEPCILCRETGKCGSCGGSGVRKVRCSACRGTGRIIDLERTAMQRRLTAEKLAGFYRAH